MRNIHTEVYTSRDTTGYCSMTAISWCSRLPRTVGTSTTEAAMMAAVETAKEAIRVYDILMAIGHDLGRPTIYHSDIW